MLSLFWGFISTMWYVKNLDILSHILVATCIIGKVENNKTNRRFKISIAYQKITNDMLEFIKYI